MVHVYNKALWIVSMLSFIAVMSAAARAAEWQREVGVAKAIPASAGPAFTAVAVPRRELFVATAFFLTVARGPGDSSALAVASDPPPLAPSTLQTLPAATGRISETTLLGLTCVGIAGVLFLLRRRRPAPI
jgi:hypothetical protein